MIKPKRWEPNTLVRAVASCASSIIGRARFKFAVDLPSSRNRWLTARRVVEIFFPLRPILKIDAHGYSPTLLERILLMAGTADSCEAAATALQVVGEMTISPRTINQLGAEFGGQLAEQRDERTRAYQEQPLPRIATQSDPAVPLAAVFCDGGRMRTRCAEGGHGVHQPHWRETKNAAFHRMQSESHSVDPQPELPACFRNQAYVEKLVLGLKKAKNPPSELMASAAEARHAAAACAAEEPIQWQPKTLLRTCVSSLANSEQFGPQMAAEADARGFFAAGKRAFVGDGQAYNWTIQRQWFSSFTAITDFIHVIEYLYEAAKALYQEPALRWQHYVEWGDACWQGNVEQVIATLQEHLPTARAPTASGEMEVHEALRRTMTYLVNNRSRMDYPHYRREGLPVTSSLAESLVKQISKRVKGTEKFWDDGPRGEAILQIRAAVISQDHRLACFLRDRPISPYSPRCRKSSLGNAT